MNYTAALTKARTLWALLRDDGRAVAETRIAANLVDVYFIGYNDAVADFMKILARDGKIGPLTARGPERPQ